MSGIDLPAVYYRRGHWYMKLAERKRRDRFGMSRRFCQRQAALCFAMAGLGATTFPDEGQWMADTTP